MVFKLAGDCSLDGPMPRIVDARRHLIGKQAALVLKKLNRQSTDILQRFEHATGNILGRALEGRLKPWSRRERQAKNAAPMMVFHQGIKSGFSVKRAYRKDRQFAPEGHEAFEYQVHTGKFGLGFGNVFSRPKSPLALAVVAHARSF